MKHSRLFIFCVIVVGIVFIRANFVSADFMPGGSIGAPIKSATASPLGEQYMLAIIVDMLDATSTLSVSDVNNIVFNPDSQFQKYYRTQSYGKTWFTGNVIEIHLVDRSVYDTKSSNDYPGICGLGVSLSDPEVLSAIKAQGIDVTRYSKILFIPRIGYCSETGGMDFKLNGGIHSFSEAWVGWTLLASLDPELVHEIGHTLGLSHSNYLACDQNNNNCVSAEYGNHFDVMGYGAGDFNAIHKEQLGWLTPDDFINITKTGDYSMNSLESTSGKKAAKIVNPACPLEALYLERRQVGITEPPYVLQNDGLLLNKLEFLNNKNGPTELIDMNPGAPSYNFTDPNRPYSDVYDVALRQGKRFSLKNFGVTIGPVVSISSSSENFYVNIHAPDTSPLPPIIKGHIQQNVQAGSNFQFWASVKNQDSICASSSSYVLDFPNLPSGWTIDAPNSILTAPNVIPQATYPTYVSANILIPNDAVPKIYTISYRIHNIANGVSAMGTSSIEIDPGPVTGSLSLTPQRITVNSGQTAVLNFSVPSNTVNASLYLYCPSGLAVKLKTAMSISTDICNRTVGLSSSSFSSITILATNSSQQVLKAVPNVYAYYSSNPNFAIGVSGEITVNPITSLPLQSSSPSPSPSSSPSMVNSSTYPPIYTPTSSPTPSPSSFSPSQSITPSPSTSASPSASPAAFGSDRNDLLSNILTSFSRLFSF